MESSENSGNLLNSTDKRNTQRVFEIIGGIDGFEKLKGFSNQFKTARKYVDKKADVFLNIQAVLLRKFFNDISKEFQVNNEFDRHRDIINVVFLVLKDNPLPDSEIFKNCVISINEANEFLIDMILSIKDKKEVEKNFLSFEMLAFKEKFQIVEKLFQFDPNFSQAAKKGGNQNRIKLLKEYNMFLATDVYPYLKDEKGTVFKEIASYENIVYTDMNKISEMTINEVKDFSKKIRDLVLEVILILNRFGYEYMEMKQKMENETNGNMETDNSSRVVFIGNGFIEKTIGSRRLTLTRLSGMTTVSLKKEGWVKETNDFCDWLLRDLSTGCLKDIRLNFVEEGKEHEVQEIGPFVKQLQLHLKEGEKSPDETTMMLEAFNSIVEIARQLIHEIETNYGCTLKSIETDFKNIVNGKSTDPVFESIKVELNKRAAEQSMFKKFKSFFKRENTPTKTEAV